MSQRYQFTRVLEFKNLGTLALGIGLAFLASTAFPQTQYKDIKVLGTSNAVSRPGPSVTRPPSARP